MRHQYVAALVLNLKHQADMRVTLHIVSADKNSALVYSYQPKGCI